ncbi:MAG: CYTH domain-containing protein [Candidatus Nanopelagicales bacterium]|jgi:inorganic triphosphatase YgiF|nr:CYTH and CHAD domain-containing protein [Actinomycetota bacterium]MBT5806096.1 CYTH and CHAD domain-containing protein [Actinomycetota bacterium]MDA9869926.1 CYTH domain-containing protein [bacterium]NCG02418.1 CYTH domain-containing protein [Actinomycetales bacterium]
MDSTPTKQHVETEFKFRVPANFELPSFPQSLGTWTTEATRNMDAIYWDTTDATLLRWGITMRTRSGGGDDGWHLKIPTRPREQPKGASVRTELHRDPTSATPPIEFLEMLSTVLQGSDVLPIARVRTERNPQALTGPSGQIVELVDDRVTLTRNEVIVDQFREIEIELTSELGLPDALLICEILRNAGAHTSSVSKAASAFGPDAKKQPDVPRLPTPDRTDLPCDLIRWALSRQVRKIFYAELTSRLAGDTHGLTRELIELDALLKALRDWFNQAEQEFLEEDLTWLIRELSIAAELADQHAQARALVNSLSDPLDPDKAAAAVDQYFAGKIEAARSSLQAARRSDRYLYLFSDLINLACVPAVTPRAYEPRNLWENISRNPCDRLTIAVHFGAIFKKKSKRLKKNLHCSQTKTGRVNASEMLRAIALSGKIDPAVIFTLGVSLGAAINAEDAS